MKKIIFLICLCLGILACQQTAQQATAIKPSAANKTARFTGTIGKEAMVVTAHPEASKVGIQILKKGGNAIDAAIAVQFALAVVYPRAGNIGGGGFMVVRLANGKTNTLDFREKAPLAAHKDLYLDDNGDVVPRLSIDGHLSVGVPGTVDGMVKAHQKYGKLNWADVLQPAIDLADNGYALTMGDAEYLNRYQGDFKKMNSTNTYFQREQEWAHGLPLIQTDLAETLKRIRDNKRKGFYQGKTAELLLAEMAVGKGIITQQDLDKYEAVWRAPIIGNYKDDYRIISMGPPSSGGVALLQMSEMTEQYPLSEWGFHDPKTAHTMIEAERLAYADRATHLGDKDFFPVPIDGLLDEQYLSERATLINPEKATRSTEIKAGNPNKKESTETTHFSIVDSEGNAVAVTTTLNGNYGSKVFVTGAGFLLNNEMDDFSAKPGVPNMFGLIGNEANAIAPEKRMLSSMTPTIIEKNGKLFMVLGSPGGATIITSVFQCFLNVVEFDMSMQEAVNASRFHHQWLPDTVFIEESTFSPQTISTLQKMGHHFQTRGSLIERRTIGKVDAVLVWEDGTLEGAADIRGEDTAFGY